MKKLLVLTAALALLAAPAFAGISATGHNLSAKGIGTDEICVFCHTPHGAQTSTASSFPLGNLTGNPTGSAICMTCHDGAVGYADIANPPNGSAAGTTYTVAAVANISAGNHHPTSGTYTQGVNVGAQLIAANYTITCSSCHDVHEPTGSPFLIMSNAGSALCLTCHNK